MSLEKLLQIIDEHHESICIAGQFSSGDFEFIKNTVHPLPSFEHTHWIVYGCSSNIPPAFERICSFFSWGSVKLQKLALRDCFAFTLHMEFDRELDEQDDDRPTLDVAATGGGLLSRLRSSRR